MGSLPKVILKHAIPDRREPEVRPEPPKPNPEGAEDRLEMQVPEAISDAYILMQDLYAILDQDYNVGSISADEVKELLTGEVPGLALSVQGIFNNGMWTGITVIAAKLGYDYRQFLPQTVAAHTDSTLAAKLIRALKVAKKGRRDTRRPAIAPEDLV